MRCNRLPGAFGEAMGMLTSTEARHVEFCIKESAMHTRGAWGVFKIFVITYRRELVAEGVFPVEDASRVVIGQVFRAEGVNTSWNGKPRLKLLSQRARHQRPDVHRGSDTGVAWTARAALGVIAS